jgi:hypothetical protein
MDATSVARIRARTAFAAAEVAVPVSGRVEVFYLRTGYKGSPVSEFQEFCS